MSFTAALHASAAQIGRHLDTQIGALGQGALSDAMAYAATGGKCFRGFLVLHGARLHDIATSQAIWPAAAIEAMHAYSLVHDDLPCMDNDALRRGRPTVHRKWDEATAVLAGDALQSLAFQLVCDPHTGPEPIRATLALSLAKAAGASGMAGGQAQDIAAETAPMPLSLAQITALQDGKTGALIGWAAAAGARLANADTGPLLAYAKALGLAFQIADDILDVEGDARMIGKATGKDAAAGKATFVSLLGLDGARRRADQLVGEAQDALYPYAGKADILREAARCIVTRKN